MPNALSRLAGFVVRAVVAAIVVMPNASAAPAADNTHDHPLALADSEKKVVRLTEHGLEPTNIVLKTLDSSVFFVNETRDSPLSLSVDFGSHRLHCATGNVKFADGKLHSVEPVGPHDFVLMCFPERGTYQVQVQGLRGPKETAAGTVTVE